MSNVNYWLQAHGIEPEERVVKAILQAAKEQNRVLADAEILEICRAERVAAEKP